MDLKLPEHVTIIEVGPRDGLQTEKEFLPTEKKAELIRRLVQAGIKEVEVTSFVHPSRVPQLSDAEQLLSMLDSPGGATYIGLVPNERGYDRAVHSGLKKIRLVVVATETFNRKNINQSVEATLESFSLLARKCETDGIAVVGVIGAAFGCPYEGHVPEERTVSIARKLVDSGIQEIVFADTTGMANPRQVYELVRRAQRELPGVTLGCHFHNTRNTGFSNALGALQAGVDRLDSSVGGLGGCPFAPRASGNVATEDLVHMVHGMGLETGIDLKRLIACAEWVEQAIGRTLPGQVMKAGPALARQGYS